MTEKKKREHISKLYNNKKFPEMVRNVTVDQKLAEDYIQYILKYLLEMDTERFAEILESTDLFYYTIGVAKLLQYSTHPYNRVIKHNEHYNVTSIDEDHKDGHNYYKDQELIAEPVDLWEEACEYVFNRLKEVIQEDEFLSQKDKDRFFLYMETSSVMKVAEDNNHYGRVDYSKHKVIDHIHSEYPNIYDELMEEFYATKYKTLTRIDDE